ncbi:hypothetical protein ACFSO0_02515 [Brevibacillus sp. GCM10020057]|uniref:hypothetical protein n=1 Tax=Brevibacillus sp. GCM10020057 TaxID=3317327 RepID=UPI00362E7179
MLSFVEMQPYLPIVLSFVTATLGYIVGIRTKKFERLYSHAQENLKDICSPMFHELKKIKREESSEQREELLKSFFEKYTDSTSNVFKLANRFMLSWFYEMEEEFIGFLKDRETEKWKSFWYKFEGFYTMLENEYYANYDLVYRDFRWMRSIWKGNSLLRIVQEMIRFLYEISVFIVIVSAFILYFTIYDLFVDTDLIPNGSIQIAIMVTLFSIVIWALMSIIASHYLSMTKLDSKKSVIGKFFLKRFPKVFSFYDKWLGNQPKWVKEKIKVPEMYQKEYTECDKKS